MNTKKITSTELARNLRNILNSLEFSKKNYIISRNKVEIGRLSSGNSTLSAKEAFDDIYNSSQEDEHKWYEEHRKSQKLSDVVRDPWKD